MPDRPLAITQMSDYEETHNLLVYGNSGVGKTVFAGTAPRALIISTERGLISAKRFGSTADVWRVNTWRDDPDDLDLVSAFNWLRDNPDHGYEWVVLDSITELQSKCLRWILDSQYAANPAKRDIDIPALQDYQKWQNMFKRTVIEFNELPVNTLWTAITMDMEDEQGEPGVMPLLLGKGYQIAQSVCAEMQAVYYLAVREVKDQPVRRLYMAHNPPYFTKDRYDIGKDMNEPTMPKVAALINRSVDKPAASPAKKTAPVKKTPVRRRRTPTK